MRQIYLTMPVKTGATGVATGGAKSVESMREKTLQVSGAFTAVLDLEATIDGTVWKALNTTLAAGFYQITGSYKQLRINTMTDGTAPEITLAALDSRST